MCVLTDLVLNCGFSSLKGEVREYMQGKYDGNRTYWEGTDGCDSESAEDQECVKKTHGE